MKIFCASNENIPISKQLHAIQANLENYLLTQVLSTLGEGNTVFSGESLSFSLVEKSFSAVHLLNQMYIVFYMSQVSHLPLHSLQS